MKRVASHPLQSLEWAEFRKKTGVKAVFENNVLLTIHPIPYTPWTIGYVPKGPLPTKKMIHDLEEIGKENNCIFIQMEPNVPAISSADLADQISNLGLRPAFHPLFTKYTFVLDMTKSEEELLKNMHPKTRYNIKVAQKHGVVVVEDNSDEAFATYLKLTRETTKRQGFYAHDEKYHVLMWKVLKTEDRKQKTEEDKLTAHLLIAKYKNEPLVAWILFVYKDTLYYPYGASSAEHKETMASNLIMWEAIRFGKKMGLKYFDMWGALGADPKPSDSWYGFHRFKKGYGTKHVEFIGSYDLVLNPVLYEVYKIADKLRWFLLKTVKS